MSAKLIAQNHDYRIFLAGKQQTVLTPFLGVGSEVYWALLNERRAIGIELKPAYFRQAVKNLKKVVRHNHQPSLSTEEVLA